MTALSLSLATQIPNFQVLRELSEERESDSGSEDRSFMVEKGFKGEHHCERRRSVDHVGSARPALELCVHE